MVKKIGTVKRPEIAIEITQYRPFYILGPVSKAGDYPYRPNLTVLQAVGIAGGFRRTADERPERESISGEGDLSVLQLNMSSYLTQLARLNAELSDAGTITFPAEINSQANNPTVRDFIKQQVSIFQSRKESMRAQLKSYEALKVLLAQEVTSLNERAQSQQRQIELAKRERDAVDTLMNKGLTVNARQSTLEQQLAQFESSRLDISTSILRAQQELSKADRDSLELRNKFKNAVSDEIHAVSLKVQETKEKINTAQALLSETDGYITKASDRNARISYTIVRKVDGKVQEIAADESTPVFPRTWSASGSTDGPISSRPGAPNSGPSRRPGSFRSAAEEHPVAGVARTATPPSMQAARGRNIRGFHKSSVTGAASAACSDEGRCAAAASNRHPTRQRYLRRACAAAQADGCVALIPTRLPPCDGRQDRGLPAGPTTPAWPHTNATPLRLERHNTVSTRQTE